MEPIFGVIMKCIFLDLMDSMTTNDSCARLFYFKVFEKIFNHSDGYLGEVMGYYVLQYFEFNPNEFIKNSKLIPDSTFKSMGIEAGIEIKMSIDEKPEVVLTKLIKEINFKTKNMNDSDKIRLRIFIRRF